MPSYVVRITGESSTGERFNGTGFLISARGHVATCCHVVTRNGRPAKRIHVYVQSYSDPWEYLIRDSSEEDDLALLEGVVPPTNDTPQAMLHDNWALDVKTGQGLAIYGHSSASNYPAGQRYPCVISAFSEKDGRVGVIGEVNPGDSGGPVIDDEERVIGIVYAKDRIRDGQARLIPVSLLINLLRRNKIPFVKTLIQPSERKNYTPNPFTSRKGITVAEAFFNREDEQLRIRDYVHARQNCQIVGPRRIGKTSLLLQLERVVSEWEENAVLAYVDLHDSRCYQLSSWLNHVSEKFSWSRPATSLAEFSQRVEGMISQDALPVLCLDEFEELTMHRKEFSRDFFLNLRSCGNMGMAIITASQNQLNSLTDPRDPTSPFYNTFPLLRLRAFSDEDVNDFLSTPRSGVGPFSPEQKEAIGAFAKGRPLALQVACYHVSNANRSGCSLTIALQKATEDFKAYLKPD